MLYHCPHHGVNMRNLGFLETSTVEAMMAKKRKAQEGSGIDAKAIEKRLERITAKDTDRDKFGKKTNQINAQASMAESTLTMLPVEKQGAES